jgi:DNA topoisomerase-3
VLGCALHPCPCPIPTHTHTHTHTPPPQALADAQAHSGAPWSAYAQRLLSPDSQLWRWPRSGGHDDKAHPPIHPLKHYPGGDREKEALFEFVVRHFLA